ncbi:MAG: ABC transporter permease [Gemmatimonadetes bacterium]|nr:ABC transporter permease [Gemmatimonadota bacterium]
MVSAVHSLRANKLRSFLTLLGIIIAVLSIIAVVTVIQGLNQKVTDLFTGRGADVFEVDKFGAVVTSRSEWQRMQRRPDLTRRDADALKRGARFIEYVSAKLEGSTAVSYRQRRVESMPVQGLGDEYGFLSEFEIARGRHMSPAEVAHNRPAAVVGPDVVDELFRGEDPLGKRIRVGALSFTIVGVARERGSTFGLSQDAFVGIPIGAYQKMFGQRESVTLAVKPADPELLQPAVEEARTILRIRHRLRPGDEDDFGIVTTEGLLRLYRQITTGVYSALVGLVAISLVVGGIVVMNIMLVAVTERTREVGIRKALGARRRDILRQFLIEAVILSALGGLIGVLLGFAVALLISATTPLPSALEWWSVALGLALSSGVGIFFGIWPAMKAARLNPIEALRYE